MRRRIYLCTLTLGISIGLTACNDQPDASAATPANTWQTTMNLQLPKIARCELSSQADHHKLSVNGLGGFVIELHEGPEITYQLLADEKLFRGDLRLPARARDSIFLLDSVGSKSLLNMVTSAKTLTLVEIYSSDKELRHDFALEGFNSAYEAFKRCLAKKPRAE